MQETDSCRVTSCRRQTVVESRHAGGRTLSGGDGFVVTHTQVA